MKIMKNMWAVIFLSSLTYGSMVGYQPGTESFAQESITTIVDDELIDHLLESCPKLQLLVARLQRITRYGANVPQRMLLVGPPGVGKSTIAKGIAVRIGRPYTYLRASLLVNEYKNSGPQNLARELVPIMQAGKPHVVIVDELHTLTEGYKKEQNVDPGTSEALWSLLDECAKNPHILFIGTTNDVTTLPDPLKNRFANAVIDISLPNLKQRVKIIAYYLRNVLCQFDDYYLVDLAKKTRGLSGRVIEQLVNDAITYALDRDGLVFVRKSDFERALHDMIVNQKLLALTGIKKYWKFIKDHQHIVLGLAGIFIPMCVQLANMYWSTKVQERFANKSMDHSTRLHHESLALQANTRQESIKNHQDLMQFNKESANRQDAAQKRNETIAVNGQQQQINLHATSIATSVASGAAYVAYQGAQGIVCGGAKFAATVIGKALANCGVSAAIIAAPFTAYIVAGVSLVVGGYCVYYYVVPVFKAADFSKVADVIPTLPPLNIPVLATHSL